MTTLSILGLILFGLMALIGHKKGMLAFVVYAINLAILFVLLIYVYNNVDPVLSTYVACLCLASLTIFTMVGVNPKGMTAFFATVGTLTLLLGLAELLTAKGLIQGFSPEQTAELQAYSPYLGIRYTRIAVSVLLLGATGAITDAAIDMSTTLFEQYTANPTLSPHRLFSVGMVVGRDLLGIMINTLFFVFCSSYITLLFMFQQTGYDFSQIINAKILVAQIAAMVLNGVGSAMVIPITAWLGSHRFNKIKS